MYNCDALAIAMSAQGLCRPLAAKDVALTRKLAIALRTAQRPPGAPSGWPRRHRQSRRFAALMGISRFKLDLWPVTEDEPVHHFLNVHHRHPKRDDATTSPDFF
jgi:hypothetical protein